MTTNGVFKQKSKLRALANNPSSLLVNVIVKQLKKVLK